jgi:HK97 gp10 family phage protein
VRWKLLKSRLPEIIAELYPAVEEATVAGAELIVEAAKSRVPVDTGRLRDAIHVETTPEGAYVIAGNRNAFYGHIVEHGSAAYGTPPHPFLVPALEENRVKVEELVSAAIRRIT